MSDLQLINDDSDLRKYRIELPNIVDDLGLSPYEGRLYVHYKRVCGANGGTCKEGTRRTARRTKMSVGQVPKARDGLAEKGLIAKIESGQYVHVKIIDIWELNFTYFVTEDRPDIYGWTIEQLKNFLKSVRIMNTLPEKRSPDEQEPEKRSPDEQEPEKRSLRERSVRTVNALSQKRSYSETKKEPINKNQPKEVRESRSNEILSLPEHKTIGLKLTEICGYAGPEFVVNSKLSDCALAVQKLTTWKATIGQLDQFEEYWWGDNPPTFNQVIEEWGKFLSSLNGNRTKKNGEAPHSPKLDNAQIEAYRAQLEADQAIAAETRERVSGIIEAGVVATGVDVGRAIRKANSKRRTN